MKHVRRVALLLLLAMPAAASVDLLIVGDSRIVADPGAEVVFHVAVSNNGTEQAVATATVPLPPGVEVLAATGTGWVCTRNAAGEVVCTRPIPPDGSFLPFAITLRLPSSLDGLHYEGTATVTSDATDALPRNNSYPFTLQARRILQVTTADDGGAGSLRSSIETANAECHHRDDCKLLFSQAMTIAPSAPLPPITACGLIVDAETFVSDPATANDFFDRPRRIEISGKNVPFGNGLEIRVRCSETTVLSGLAVNGFPQNGLLVASTAASGFASVILDGFFIGTDASGTQARPNGWRGISLEEQSQGCDVRRSVISGNARSGIANWSAAGLAVTRCRIGASATGEVLPNGASGIFTNAGSTDVAESVVAGNRQFGIAVGGGAAHAVVFDSFLNGNGGIGLDWGMDGPSPSGSVATMPGVPHLTDAFYDLASGTTIVRGSVSIDADGTYAVEPYFNGPSTAGYGGDGSGHGLAFLPKVSSPQEVTFEVTMRGDYSGRVLTAVTQRYRFLDFPPIDSSEFSAGIRVR